MKKFAFVAVGGIALIAAACSPDLDTARALAPTGTEFQRALYNGYLDLAQAELDENDFDDARFFAHRAQQAARGETVLPQAVRHRLLAPETAQEMSESRERLLQALESGGREKMPRDAAVAQLSFDCWLQEIEENIQPIEVANCRGRFRTALAGLGATANPAKLAGATSRPAISPVADRPATRVPMTVAETPPSGPRFTVLFGHDSANLTPDGLKTLREATRVADGAGSVVVSGYADRSGPEIYNMGLSDRRARAVAMALTAGKGMKIAVETRAFGEGRPAVATRDGVLEPRNRRVEIQLREALARTASRQ